MIHRILVVALVVALFAPIAFATDIDRHGTFTAAGATAAATQCKNFVGTDDNRSACTDWCSSFLAANTGASCGCDDGACSADAPAAPMAAAAPATAH
jgi:hypothetical protein